MIDPVNAPRQPSCTGEKTWFTRAARYQQPVTIGIAVICFCIIAIGPLIALMPSTAGIHDILCRWDRFVGIKPLTFMLNGVGVGFISAVVALGLGVPAGLVIGQKARPFHALWPVLFFLPLAIPPYLAASCWIALTGRNGILPDMVVHLLSFDPGAPWLSGWSGSGIILGACYFPIPLFLVISGLKAQDPAHEEAALFSMTPWQTLRKISLPLLLPHLSTAGLIVFLMGMTNYSVPSLLGVRTMTVKIFSFFSIYKDPTGATALAFPMLAIGGLSAVLLHRLTRNRAFFSLDRGGPTVEIARFFLHPAFRIPAISIPVVITSAPVLYLTWKTGSLQNLGLAVQQIEHSVLKTCVLAALGSLCLSLLALVLGYAIDRLAHLRKGWLSALFFLPFCLPSVLLGIGIIYQWNQLPTQWVYSSSVIIVILWGAKYLPLAQRLAADHMKQIPVEFEAAASLSGLTWFNIAARILWPLSRPGFLVVWATTYIFCISELGGTLLVIPPGADTLPVRLFNMMHYGSSSMVAALGLLMIGLTALPLLLMAVYGRIVQPFPATAQPTRNND